MPTRDWKRKDTVIRVYFELFQLHLVIENRLLQHLREKSSECMGFGGSMVARLKLKGIDGRAHQEWSLRLNLTQHGETYQGQIAGGLTAKLLLRALS